MATDRKRKEGLHILLLLVLLLLLFFFFFLLLLLLLLPAVSAWFTVVRLELQPAVELQKSCGLRPI